MKILLILIHLSILTNANGQTKLYILGTVHNPTKNFTADSIATILSKIQPDLILQELDSSFFTTDFKLIREINTIESIGIDKYISIHPTPIRPYDISGRNNYYSANNTFTLEKESFNKLNSIKKRLSAEHKGMYSDLLDMNERLRQIGKMRPYDINQQSTYKLVEKRQILMYKKLLKIYESRKELKDYRVFYKENGDFWDKRNKAMAMNIITFLDIDNFKNKNIVVLTGFYHKYYLLNELKSKQDKHQFIIMEYYE